MKPVFLAAVGAVVLSSLSGCASSSREAVSGGVAPKVVAVTPGDLDRARAAPVRAGDGRPVSWSELVSACAGADAVLVGERHGFVPGLNAAAALWADLLAASPRAALALEFWERDRQNALDDYLTGVTDEAGLLKAAGLTGNNAALSYPAGHRAMVDAAKAAGRPVIAANAPRRYVRMARLDGYERLGALLPAQRAMFRIPDRLATGRYRDDFERIMGAKPEQPEHEAMFRSQQVWDWTMAQSVASNVEAGNTPTLLVVGAFHIEHNGGLVQALRELRQGAKIVTVSFVSAAELNPDKPDPRAAPEDGTPRADFVVVLPK